jgi:hypothetical protein
MEIGIEGSGTFDGFGLGGSDAVKDGGFVRIDPVLHVYGCRGFQIVIQVGDKE